MATDKWISKNGAWSYGANWSLGSAPTIFETVVIQRPKGDLNTDICQIGPGFDAQGGAITLTGRQMEVFDEGTLTIGSTLTLANHATLGMGGTVAGEGGVLSGGTIVESGGTFFSNLGTIDGVTLEGPFTVGGVNGRLHIGAAGVTLVGAGGLGAGTLDLEGLGDFAEIENTQTLSNATINLGNGGGAGLYEFDSTGSGQTLTLGAGLTMDQGGKHATLGVYKSVATYSAADQVVNLGTINAGVASGRLAIVGGEFVDEGVINVSNGDTLALQGAHVTIAATGVISGAGVVTGVALDEGLVEAIGGTLRLTAAVGGTGGLKVGDGAVLVAAGGVAQTITTTFASGNGTFALANAGRATHSLAGFIFGDVIDLMGLIATSATLGAGGALVLTNGGTEVASFSLQGSYGGDQFNVASDGAGGTDLTVSPSAARTGPFVAAMAGIGSSHGPASPASHPHDLGLPQSDHILSRPHALE
jgi:hypothetical protein